MIEDTRNLAEKDPDEIRQEIDVTRSSITTKLEALEEQVAGTVQNARDSVQETIDTVKDTVQETVSAVKETVKETVSTVKDTFDLRLQVERHPWPMLGGSILAGFITGTVFHGMRRQRDMPMERLVSHGETPQRAAPLAAREREEAPAPREPGLLDRFQDEIDQVKGMAIGMIAGLVRDAIKDSVQERMPRVAEQVESVVDRITTKLGGKPVPGPVFKQDAAPDLGPRY